LDPDYLNAWVKLQSVDEHIYLLPAERDAIAFNILRLDPMHHRLTPSFELVSDLAALWNQVAALEKKTPLAPDSLYPLAASKVELEKQPAAAADRPEMDVEYQSQMMERDAAITPGKAVSQNGFIQAALSIFGSESTLLGDE
jgi:hypothetical protein